MTHICTEQERIKRIEKFIYGNGGRGLIRHVAETNTNVMNIKCQQEAMNVQMEEVLDFIRKQHTRNAVKSVLKEQEELKRKKIRRRWNWVKWIIYILVVLGVGLIGFIIG